MHVKPFVLTFFVAAALFFLPSCLKQSNNTGNNSPARLSVINMSPNAPYFNVVLDDQTLLNIDSIPFATYLGQPGLLQYFTVYSGIHDLVFVDSAGSLLVSGNTEYSPGANYTVYLFDTVSSAGLEAVQLQDNTYDSIPRGMSMVRFLDFSPDAGNLDLVYKDSVYLYQSTPYVGNTQALTSTLSQFLTVPAGLDTFDFNLSGTTGPTPTVLKTMILYLAPDSAYTLYAAGLELNDTTGAQNTNPATIFRVGVIRHDPLGQ